MPTQLQNVRPDFDEFSTALGNLLKNKESWLDLYEGATGQTLIEFMSAIGVYNQHGIESHFLETYLSTARRSTSIYAITRMLGVRVGRRLSPQVTVRISRTNAGSPYVIAPYTTFSAEGQTMVNPEPIIFEIGQLDVSVPLFMGSVQQQEVFSDGTNFQEITITGSGPFSVSDQHIEVRVNTTQWKIVYDGLWNYTNTDRIVSDTTSRDGDLVLLFGDDKYGVAPNLNEVITIRWIDTQGLDTPVLSAGTKVTVPVTGMTAITASTFSSGANEKSPEFYRVMAPTIFREKDKPVTVEGYTAKALEYPGIVDCRVIPQRDLDPYDVRLMNVIHMSLLIEDGSVWTTEVDAPAAPTFLTVENGGSLGPATYSYKITAVNEVGESDPSPAGSYALLVPGSLLLRWPTVMNALSYRIYGRTSGSWQFIAEKVPTATEVTDGYVKFLDDGTTFPAGTIPSVNNTQASWWTFQQWFQKFKHASVRLVQMTPVMVPVDVQVELYVRAETDLLETIRGQAYTRIVELFAPRLGSIGRKVMLSDIVAACKVPKEEDPAASDVDYVRIVKPMADVIPEGIVEYLYLNSISISAVYTDRRERFE